MATKTPTPGRYYYPALKARPRRAYRTKQAALKAAQRLITVRRVLVP